MLIDYREQLTAVNDGILAILEGGQQFTVGDKHYTRANLGEAMALQTKLIGMVNQQQSVSSNGRVRYGRPL